MKGIVNWALILAAVATSVVARAATVEIDIEGFQYVWGTKTGTMYVRLNDTVRWKNNDAVPHTVTSVSGPVAFDSGDMAAGAEYTRTHDTLGTYDYTCTHHPNMAGKIVVVAGKSVTINIQNLAFGTNNNPVTVNAGDTVRWDNKSTFTHTVTSAFGTGGPRIADGVYFDRSLTPGSTFDYTFCQADTWPYFCRPHAGMVSRIIVKPLLVRGDVDGDGSVGMSDVTEEMRILNGLTALAAGGLETADVAPAGALDGAVTMLDAMRLARFVAGVDATPL